MKFKKKPVWILFITALLISQEAHVSVQPDYIDLKKLVAKSPIIVRAVPRTKLGGMRKERIEDFEVLEVLKGQEPLVAKGKRLEVFQANAELFEEIAAAGRRGEPTPMPILPVYKSSYTGADYLKGTELILFLATDGKGRMCYAVEGGWEKLDFKPQVQGYLQTGSQSLPEVSDPPSKAALQKFNALPQVMTGAPGSEEAVAKYRKEKKSFVEAVAYRNLETCQSGQHEFTHVIYKIYGPKKGLFGTEKSFELPNLEIHETQAHGAQFRPEVLKFLEKL